METIFLAIQEQIATGMPDLSLVDEDCGQLETQEDTYPVTFPCVLIGNIDAVWTNVGIGFQRGEATVTVRLAIDCYDDTHYASGTQDKIRERLLKNKALYKLLQGFYFSKEVTSLIRIRSRDYSLPRGIKVYETEYRFTVNDKCAMTP